MSSLNFAASLVFHHMSFSHIFYSDKKHKNENQPRFCINKGDMRDLKRQNASKWSFNRWNCFHSEQGCACRSGKISLLSLIRLLLSTTMITRKYVW